MVDSTKMGDFEQQNLTYIGKLLGVSWGGSEERVMSHDKLMGDG